MGKKKPPAETAEEKAARKAGEAARFGEGGQLESLVEAAGCSCTGLLLGEAIKEVIVGGPFQFFSKDEAQLQRGPRAQLPGWDPQDKTRSMLDDYSELVSELRREEIDQDRARVVRSVSRQKEIRGPGPAVITRMEMAKKHARAEGLTLPEYFSEKKKKDAALVLRKRLKLKDLEKRIAADAYDPRPSLDEVRSGSEVVIQQRFGSRAKALSLKRLAASKQYARRAAAMVLSELIYCSHLVGFNDFQMDNPLKTVSCGLFWAPDRTARDKTLLVKEGITHIVNCSPNLPNRFSKSFVYCRVRVAGGSKAPQNTLFEEYSMAIGFVQNALSLGGKVLVTCANGHDCSACLLLAYLIQACDVPLATAFKLLKVHEPLLQLSRSNTLFITLFEIEMMRHTSIRKHRELATPVFLLVAKYVAFEPPLGIGTYFAFGNIQMGPFREFVLGRAPLAEPKFGKKKKKPFNPFKSVYRASKAASLRVGHAVKGYGQSVAHALYFGPRDRHRRRRKAKKRITHYDATRADKPRPWPRVVNESSVGAQGALVRPPSAGGARPRSAAAVFPDLAVGWEGVPRLCRPPTLWAAPGDPPQKKRPPSRQKRDPAVAAAVRARLKARPSSAPAGSGRRRRRAKVQLLEPLPTVPQDEDLAEISKVVADRVDVLLPPLTDLKSSPPTPQISARPATAEAPMLFQPSVDSDSLLTWQPGVFLQPSLDSSMSEGPTAEESATYWRKRKQRGEKARKGAELCAAYAKRAFDAVETTEMSLDEGARVLVLREDLSTEPGWTFATQGDEAGYVPRNYLVLEVPLNEVPSLVYESESETTAVSASAFYRAVL